MPGSVGVVLLKPVKKKPSLQPGLAGAQAGTKRALCERDAPGDGAELIPGGTESPETKRGEAQKGPFFLFCPGDGREPHMGIKKPQVIKPPGTKRGREGEGMAERTLHGDLMGKKGAGRLRSHGASWICQV